MKEFDIIPYDRSYRENLFSYLKRIALNSSDSYINYSIDKSEGLIPSILVIGENKTIVGCHLHFTTRLQTKGKEQVVAWGHETFLDEDYRSSAGIEFVMAINKKNTLGIGYTDINYKIQKKLRQNIELITVFNYFLLDRFFLLGVIKKFFNNTILNLKEIKTINTSYLFNIVNSADSVLIPNSGYWYDEHISFDMIRDREYIKERFINNKVFKYCVYETHHNNEYSCYFVVRPFKYRGIPALLLVDYRFWGRNDLMDEIIKAVTIIARKNHIGLIQTTGGMRIVDDVLHRWNCIRRKAITMIHKSLKPSESDYVSLTPADSDVDFNR